jgi:hypothetical protein
VIVFTTNQAGDKMKKKFRAGDIVKFGYGMLDVEGKPSAYRTILLLEKQSANYKDTEHLWRAELLNDSRNYYSDNVHHFIVDDTTELVWRARKKKVFDRQGTA